MMVFQFLKKTTLLLLLFNVCAQHEDSGKQFPFLKPHHELNLIPNTKFCFDFDILNAKQNINSFNSRIKKLKSLQLPFYRGIHRGFDNNIMKFKFKCFIEYETYLNNEKNSILLKKRFKTKSSPIRFCKLFRLNFVLNNNLLCNNAGILKISKRGLKIIGENQRRFVPSISTGAMTHLGDFFKGLSNNVNFSENAMLGIGESRLLTGNYPLHMINEEISSNGHENPIKTAEFLHAIRSYRPAQKIRSLISLTPPGYHASHFIDPNYMWVGLGK